MCTEYSVYYTFCKWGYSEDMFQFYLFSLDINLKEVLYFYKSAMNIGKFN